jgi:hypothetical protein
VGDCLSSQGQFAAAQPWFERARSQHREPWCRAIPRLCSSVECAPDATTHFRVAPKSDRLLVQPIP